MTEEPKDFKQLGIFEVKIKLHEVYNTLTVLLSSDKFNPNTHYDYKNNKPIPSNIFVYLLFQRKIVAQLKEGWMKNIKRGLLREISMLELIEKRMLKSPATPQLNLYPYLRVLDLQAYADVVLQEVEKLMEGSEIFSQTLTYLYKDLGNQVKLRLVLLTISL